MSARVSTSAEDTIWICSSSSSIAGDTDGVGLLIVFGYLVVAVLAGSGGSEWWVLLQILGTRREERCGDKGGSLSVGELFSWRYGRSK